MEDQDPGAITDIARFQAALADLIAPFGSVREISRASGVSKSTVAQILGRERVPQQATMDLLARRFDPTRHEAWLAAWQRVRTQRPGPARRLPSTGLPQATPHFCGRDREIVAVREALLSGGAGGAVPSVMIEGMAGVGKTALIVQIAHDMAAEFPGGCHFVELNGYSATLRPRTWYESLGLLLRTLDRANAVIPEDPQDRLDLYRRRLADTTSLVILDNARTADQVRPLLAGDGRSRVVVTSRHQLPSLDDVRPITLRCLGREDGVSLLEAVVPADRRLGEDDLLPEVVQMCGGLPLALRILGARFVRRGSWTLRHLVDRLADNHRRLAELDDGERSLAAAFRLSYDDLDGDLQPLFSMLGVAPGRDIDLERAVALTGADPASVERDLESLVDHNLLLPPRPGRYQLHDLLAVYASQLAEADPARHRATSERVLAWTARTATARAGVLLTETQDRPSGSRADVREWFIVERDNLVAAVCAATAQEMYSTTIHLGTAITRPLLVAGQYDDVLLVATHRLEAAAALGDIASGAAARLAAGQVKVHLHRHSEALHDCEVALADFALANDAAGEGAALKEIGNIHWYRNEYGDALEHYRRSLPLHQQAGDRAGEARTLSNIGAACWQLGDATGAARNYEAALLIRRSIGDVNGVAETLNNLGLLHERQGSLDEARAVLTEALALGSSITGRAQSCATLTNLGNVCRRMQQFADGEKYFAEAIAIATAIRSRVLEAEAVNCLGDLTLAAGRPGDARSAYDNALRLSAGGVDRYEEAHAYEGIGNVLAAEGDQDLAEHRWRTAATLYESLGVTPDLERVMGMLRPVRS